MGHRWKRLRRVSVTNSGENYQTPPAITVAEPAAPKQEAKAISSLDNGSVNTVNLDSGGNFYSNPPTVTLSAPDSGGTQATAAAILNNGEVSKIQIVDSGSGYSSPPQVTIAKSTDPKSDFAAQVTLDFDSATGTVTKINVVDSGNFYDSDNPPTVTIDKPFPNQNFEIGEDVEITGINADSTAATVTGEVADWVESSGKLTVIHVANDTGDIVEPSSNSIVTAVGSGATSIIATVENPNTVDDNSDEFDDEAADFLDFSESNPFGEPEAATVAIENAAAIVTQNSTPTEIIIRGTKEDPRFEYPLEYKIIANGVTYQYNATSEDDRNYFEGIRGLNVPGLKFGFYLHSFKTLAVEVKYTPQTTGDTITISGSGWIHLGLLEGKYGVTGDRQDLTAGDSATPQQGQGGQGQGGSTADSSGQGYMSDSDYTTAISESPSSMVWDSAAISIGTSTIRYEEKYSFAGHSSIVGIPRNIIFGDNGRKLFYVSGGAFTNSAIVYGMNLSKAYDLTSIDSATGAGILDLNSHFTNILDSASYSGQYDEFNMLDMWFNPDGTKMWVSGNSWDTVIQFALDSAWNPMGTITPEYKIATGYMGALQTGTLINNWTYDANLQMSNYYSHEWIDSGRTLISGALGTRGTTIKQEFSSPYNISTATTSFTAQSIGNYGHTTYSDSDSDGKEYASDALKLAFADGGRFNHDGTERYFIHKQFDDSAFDAGGNGLNGWRVNLVKATLDTPYDITTMKFANQTEITNLADSAGAPTTARPSGTLTFHPDGSRFFIMSTGSNATGTPNYSDWEVLEFSGTGDSAGSTLITTPDITVAPMVQGTYTLTQSQSAVDTDYSVSGVTGDALFQPSNFGSFYTNANWFDFNKDGTKIFIHGTDPGAGYGANAYRLGEFNLSTAYDVSTFDSTPVNTQVHPDGNSYEGKFGDDGNKWYATSGNMAQYNLPGAYDITSWSQSTTNNANVGPAGGNSFAFKSDGTRIYGVNTNSGGLGVTAFPLGTPWELNTVGSLDSSYNYDSNITTTSGIEFTNAGTKMYILARVTAANEVGIVEYDLADSWNISSATYSNKFLNLGNDGFVNDENLTMRLVNNNIFYVMGNNSNYAGNGKAIYKYDLTNISVSNVANATASSGSLIQFSAIDAKHTNAYWFEFNNDGSKLYLPENNAGSYDEIITYDITNYDPTTTSNPSTYTNSAIITVPKSLIFNHDGTKIIIFGNSGDPNAKQYDLNTPYDVSSVASNTPSATINNDPSYREWTNGTYANNGQKLYLMQQSSSGILREYNVSTAGDLSTASVVGSSNEIDLTSALGNGAQYGIQMNSTGTRLYVGFNPSGGADPELHQWNLSTPYDLSTATKSSSLTIGASNYFAEFQHMVLVNDTDFYIAGLRTPSGQYGIWKYTLGTGSAATQPTVVKPQQSIQNLATDSAQQLTWSTVSNDYGLEVSPDGKTIVMKDLGQNDWRVFSMSTAYDLTTAVRDTNKEPTLTMTDSAHKFKSHGMTFTDDWSKLATTRIGTPLDIYKNEISMYDITNGASAYSLDRIDDESDGNRTSSWGTLAFEAQITDQDGTNHDQRPENIQFGDAGKKLYWTNLNGSTNLISQWNLASPYTIDLDMVDSGGLYTPSITTGDSSTLGAAVNHDGSRIYMLTNTNTESRGIGIYQLDLADSWDVKTATWDSDKFLSIGSDVTDARGDIAVTQDYLYVSLTASGSTVIRRYKIEDSTTPPPPGPDSDGNGFLTAANWIITVGQGPLYEDSATTGNVFYAQDVASASDLTFGLQPSTANRTWSGGKIRSLTPLNTGFNTYQNVTSPNDLATGDQGNIYVLDGTTTIKQFITSDSADLTNLSYLRSFTLDGTDNLSISFKRDGSQLYTVGGTSGKIKTYDLSTSWDISTAVQNTAKTFTVPDDNNPRDFIMSPWGNGMIVLGGQNNTIYQYALDSESYDPSTAGSSYANLDVGAITNVNGQLGVSPNATKIKANHTSTYNMYIFGQDHFATVRDYIYQGSISWPGLWRKYDQANNSSTIADFNFGTMPENEEDFSDAKGFDFSFTGRTIYSIYDDNFKSLSLRKMDWPNMTFGTE